MKKLLTAAGLVLLASSATALDITPMTDPTGRAMLDRLFSGTGLDLDTALEQSDYTGLTEIGNTQGALFSNLLLRGAQSTSASIPSGIMLTSGIVNLLPTTNTSTSFSGITDTGGSNDIEDMTTGSPASGGRHSNQLRSFDQNELRFRVSLPAGVSGVAARFVYASDEFPEFAGTMFADGFVFLVNDVNYARIDNVTPVSLMKQEDVIHFMTNGESGQPGAPPIVDLEFDGLTRVLDLVAPVTAGVNEFTIVVSDTGDQIYDSAVFLSGLSFIMGGPLASTEIGVKLSDDDYLEFDETSAVPVPASLPLACSAVAFLAMRRRRPR